MSLMEVQHFWYSKKLCLAMQLETKQAWNAWIEKKSFIIPICSIAIFASKAKWRSSSKSISENSTCNVTLNTALTHQTLRAVLKQNVIVTTRMSKLNKRTIVAFGQAVKSS